MTSRRNFMRWSAGACAGLAVPRLWAAVPSERALALYNTHTGERLTATYWAEGGYLADGLQEINHILRDHRSGEIFPIDPSLFDILHRLQAKTGARGEFHVISGYRSPSSNASLRRTGGGVARNSLHTRGQAIDIRLPGTELSQLRRAALSLRAGGVGYYPRSDFVHVDTGRVRFW